MQVERNIGIEGSSKPPMTPRKRKVSFVDVPQAAPSEIPNAKEKKRKSNSGSVMATKSSKPPSNVSALHGGPSGSKEPALNLQEGHIEESGLAGEGSVPAGQPEAPAKVTRKTIKLRNSYTGNLAADSNLPLHDTADTPPVIGASTSPSDANEKNPPTKKPASKRSNLSLGPNAKKRVVASRQTAKSVSTQEPIDRVDGKLKVLSF
jgi:hypothetical protein